MINRLFSSFDPIRRTLRTNYLIMGSILLFPLIRLRWIITNRIQKAQINTNWIISNEIKASLNRENNKRKVRIITSIFFIILRLNIIGLRPYVFTLTAHIMFTFALAMPFWIGFIMFSAIKNTTNFLAHLVPLRTPIALSHFITVIETIRQMIRPITLSVRIAANITAGHILIALVRAPIIILNPITLVLIILFLLEVAVAFIQRYVFTLLLTIYLRETN